VTYLSEISISTNKGEVRLSFQHPLASSLEFFNSASILARITL
jgi:hypothetical protein